MTTAQQKLSTVLGMAYCRTLGPSNCKMPCVECIHDAKEISGELAKWLRVRYGGSSQTADLLDAAFYNPQQPQQEE